MRNFITILIILALSFIMYTPAQSGITIKQEIQRSLAPNMEGPVQPHMTSFCQRQINKYEIRITKLRAKTRLTLGERWSLGYNKDRLAYWTEFCTTGIDPDTDEE